VRRGAWAGWLALALVGGHVLLSLAGPLLVPHSPTALLGDVLQPWGGEHPFGTDLLGRDYLSRLLLGGRTAIGIAAAGVALAIAAGAALGIAAAYVGGWLDEAAMRLVDALTAIPDILLLSMLVLGFGTGHGTLVLILVVVYAPPVARILRAQAIALAAQDFVRAAELRGETRLAVMAREIAPNLVGILAVEGAIRLSGAVLRISALSFLGLGVRPPTPDWGLMVQEAMGVVFTRPDFLLLPAMLLASFVLAANLGADRLARHFGYTGQRGG
jgi:peptide/nickel transport system permease protein